MGPPWAELASPGRSVHVRPHPHEAHVATTLGSRVWPPGTLRLPRRALTRLLPAAPRQQTLTRWPFSPGSPARPSKPRSPCREHRGQLSAGPTAPLRAPGGVHTASHTWGPHWPTPSAPATALGPRSHLFPQNPNQGHTETNGFCPRATGSETSDGGLQSLCVSMHKGSRAAVCLCLSL